VEGERQEDRDLPNSEDTVVAANITNASNSGGGLEGVFLPDESMGEKTRSPQGIRKPMNSIEST
jgi:hypothetical protein